MPASAPKRSTVKLVVTIGVLPIHIDVFSAVEESNVSRSMFTTVGNEYHRVGMRNYDTITGSDVEKSDIVKCVTLDDDTLVEISDAEMAGVLSAENGECTFIGFLPVADFDYATEKPYQIRPTKSKTKKDPYVKPFSLIMATMASTETVALISYVSRNGKTRYAALGPDATMATLYFDEEVREQLPLNLVELSPQELAMGETFVNSFKLDTPPVLHDADSEKILQFAADKAKTLAEGGTVVIPTAATTEAADSDDLMALLAASVNP